MMSLVLLHVSSHITLRQCSQHNSSPKDLLPTMLSIFGSPVHIFVWDQENHGDPNEIIPATSPP